MEKHTSPVGENIEEDVQDEEEIARVLLLRGDHAPQVCVDDIEHFRQVCGFPQLQKGKIGHCQEATREEVASKYSMRLQEKYQALRDG